MMAGQPPGQPVLHHPGGAIGALEAVPAGPAQRQRRIAAPVEEQQRLLAARQRLRQRLHQSRREPAAALGRFADQVDRGDRRHLRRAVAAGQLHLGVAAERDLLARLDRRGRGGEDHRAFLEQPAHHRDVAGVIVNAFLLLEARLVRFVDDDQAQAFIRQEQRRSGAHRHQRLAARDRAPRTAALGGAQARMPGDGLAAEPVVEALQERLGQCDLGQQDQGLSTRPDRRGDRLEIDFGFARARDPVEQRRREPVCGDVIRQDGRGGVLISAQDGRRMIGVGHRERAVDIDRHRLDRARLHQAADHPVRHVGDRGEFADQSLAVGDPFQCLGALRR